MTDLEKIEKMVSTLQEQGYDAEVYEDYSGRGMCGDTCMGVSTSARYARVLEAATAAELPEPHCESLGKGLIAYWPQIRAQEGA